MHFSALLLLAFLPLPGFQVDLSLAGGRCHVSGGTGLVMFRIVLQVKCDPALADSSFAFG